MKRELLYGFTLIELMIVIVIIGILAGIAYPGYRSYMTQTRRSDAKIALTQAAARQEKFFSDAGWYATKLDGTRAFGASAGDPNAILGLSAAGKPAKSPDGHYTLTIAAGNISGCTTFSCGFTITATPTAGGLQVGDGAFRIDALGTKQWDSNNDSTFGANENTWGK